MNSSPEWRKECLARDIWKRRNKPTPSAIEKNRAAPTWGQWFHDRYGQTLEDYRRELKG